MNIEDNRFLQYFKGGNYFAFGGLNPLYHAILTYALYKSEQINRESYFARLRVIRKGYKRIESNRKSNLIGWHNYITKQELLEKEVEQCVPSDFDVKSIEVLTQVILDLRHNSIVKKKDAKREATYQMNQYLTDGILRSSYGSYYDYDDLSRMYTELEDMGYNLSMPWEEHLASGYCCRDCDGCLGQYKSYAINRHIDHWKIEIEKQNKNK